MKHFKTTDSEPPNEGDPVGDLIELAGEKPGNLRAEDFARHRDAARLVWKRQLKRRRRRRAAAVASLLAASVLIVLGLRTLESKPPSVPSPEQVATVTATRGAIERRKVEMEAGIEAVAEWATLVEGDPIMAGGHLRARSAAALELGTGVGVRLAPGTEVVVQSVRQVELVAGRTYIDTDQAAPDLRASAEALISVTAGSALIRDIGTRFEVEAAPSELLVRVRSGQVTVARAGATETASAGEQLRVTDSGGTERSALSASSESWEWILEVAPTFHLDGATLGSYLEWLTSETGWIVEFATPELERDARSSTLTGSSTAGFDPRETYQDVLDSVGLSHRLENGRLRLE